MDAVMQAKDIPEGPLLDWLARQDMPATWWETRQKNVCGNGFLVVNDGLAPTVLEAMPAGTPPKVALAKMRSLIRRGLVEGCGCGCRGDFESMALVVRRRALYGF